MKYFLLFMVLGFLFISQDIAFSQKKAKKIENYDINGWVSYMYWCTHSNGYTDPDCCDKVKIDFTNNSAHHVSSVTFKLTIEINGSVYYKKKHTISVDLDAGDTTPYDVKLTGKVTAPPNMSVEDMRAYIEVISVK